MVKKFKEIFISQKPSSKIYKKGNYFKHYLIREVLEDKYASYIDKLANATNVYIFSGVIRDFFLNRKGNRDLDIVVDEIPKAFLEDIQQDIYFISYKRNKFNGIKISLQNLNIDIWQMKDTWGIQKKNLPVKVESLLKVPFFNFSSIVYDYKQTQFLVSESFKQFLDSRTLDVVFTKNIENDSCIISTMYYAREFHIGVSQKLARWLRDKYDPRKDLMAYQIKRYGKKEFSKEEIKAFIHNPEIFKRV